MHRLQTFLFAMIIALFAAGKPAHARIFRTKPSASLSWSELPLVVGSGFEFETDRQESDYDFPILVEYNFTKELKVSIEPNFSYIHSKTLGIDSTGGFGDLETTLEYEFVPEREILPAFSFETVVTWPTATNTKIDSQFWSYSFGLVGSKQTDFFDFDLNASYSFSNEAAGQDRIEISLAGEKDFNEFLGVQAEVVTTESGFEGLLGLAEHMGKHFKLEDGFILRNDLSWQVVFAWEWSFMTK